MAPADVVARIQAASHALGVAFQLSDDILDVAAESAQSGKAPGTDLREGVRSLPVLHALASRAPGDDRLRELLSRDGLTDESLHAEALQLLRAHPAMETAHADVRRWADTARAEVAGLPDVPARRAFELMCDFVMERTS
jgi:heptaprenyl diphosphate synthase